MPLSKTEKEDVMQTLDVEIMGMFDRLLNHYSDAEKTEHARLLPELEQYIKDGLLNHPNSV